MFSSSKPWKDILLNITYSNTSCFPWHRTPDEIPEMYPKNVKLFAVVRNPYTKIVSAYKVEEMIVALPSAGSKAIETAAEFGRKAGLKKIKIVPPDPSLEKRFNNLFGNWYMKYGSKSMQFARAQAGFQRATKFQEQKKAQGIAKRSSSLEE